MFILMILGPIVSLLSTPSANMEFIREVYARCPKKDSLGIARTRLTPTSAWRNSMDNYGTTTKNWECIGTDANDGRKRVCSEQSCTTIFRISFGSSLATQNYKKLPV